MTSFISQLSHGINADTVAASMEENSSGSSTSSGKTRGRPKKTSREHTPDPPAPPPPPPPSRPPPPQKKSVKMDKTPKDEEEHDRRDLERKVRGYRMNPKLRARLGDLDIPENLSRMSDSALRELYDEIQFQMNFAFRQIYVDKLFGVFFKGIEKAAVAWTQTEEFLGLEQAAVENKEEFEPELSEFANEISDSFIPGVKGRMFMKMVNFTMAYQEAYHFRIQEKKMKMRRVKTERVEKEEEDE